MSVRECYKLLLLLWAVQDLQAARMRGLNPMRHKIHDGLLWAVTGPTEEGLNLPERRCLAHTIKTAILARK